MPKCSFRGAALAALLAAGLAAAAARSAEPGGQALAPQMDAAALAAALREGGLTILMRHTETAPFAPDPATFDIADCKTQRNLSDKGREQARAIAAALPKLGIRVSRVDSSPFCRCLETARLAFGKVEVSELLTIGDDLSYAERHERGRAVRQMLATAPEAGTNRVLLTHTGALLYSFGLDSKPEGIAHVFRPGPAGTAVYLGRLLPDDWPRLAAASAPAGPAPAASDAKAR